MFNAFLRPTVISISGTNTLRKLPADSFRIVWDENPSKGKMETFHKVCQSAIWAFLYSVLFATYVIMFLTHGFIMTIVMFIVGWATVESASSKKARFLRMSYWIIVLRKLRGSPRKGKV